MRGKDDEADDSNGNNSSATLNHANQTTGAQAAASWRCENPKVRVEWSRMAENDKQWYLESIKCLMETPPLGVWSEAESLWDEIAWVHNRLIPSIHDVDTFLPWHRYYLHLQSSLLEEYCSYTGPIPWWRETSYTGDFASSELFTPEYFGSLPPAPRIGDGTCITDGPFVNTTVRFGDDAPTCISRGEDTRRSGEVTEAALDLCHGDSQTSYKKHARCVERTIHSNGHGGIGGTMSRISAAPVDPLFYIHHAFVDWQWARWQEESPSRRKTTISGCAEGHGSGCVRLTEDTVLAGLGVFPDMTVADVLDTENKILCYTYDDFA
ncbi:tyrosinase-like protein [Corynascus similis CBS 632.67]